MYFKGKIKELLGLISVRKALFWLLGLILGLILGVLGLILRVLGGAQSALDYKGNIRPIYEAIKAYF